jgi:hypothetical protein
LRDDRRSLKASEKGAIGATSTAAARMEWHGGGPAWGVVRLLSSQSDLAPLASASLHLDLLAQDRASKRLAASLFELGS